MTLTDLSKEQHDYLMAEFIKWYGNLSERESIEEKDRWFARLGLFSMGFCSALEMELHVTQR